MISQHASELGCEFTSAQAPAVPDPHSLIKNRHTRIPFGSLFRRVGHSVLFRALRWLKQRRMARGTISEAFQFWYDLPVDPVHFYSPLPDVHKIQKNLARWRQPSTMPSVNMDLFQQAAFVRNLYPFSSECAGLPTMDEIRRAGYGLGYGEMEAQFLHCIIRYLKPRRIIEVGSGVTTFFALNALDGNSKDAAPRQGAMYCIEPYPSEKLKELHAEKRIALQVTEVQDVPVSFFGQLEENDILFIDSTHAGKLDSDVYRLYLEILPVLKPGVVVHIHDICFPFLTCPPEHPSFPLSMLWNECALCQAFLSFNDSYQILVCQSFLHERQPEIISGLLNSYDPKRHFPSSLWLRRAA